METFSSRPSCLLVLLFIGYTLLSLARRALQDVHSILISKDDDFLSTSDLGMFLSAQTIGYTLTKLLSGIAMDRVNPIRAYIITHWMTSVTLFAMAVSRNWYNWLCWSTLNGLFLGVSWPAIGKILRVSVPSNELATWWGVISMSINLAGATGPWIALTLNKFTLYWVDEGNSWKVLLCVVGSMCFLLGTVLTFYPQSWIHTSSPKCTETHSSDRSSADTSDEQKTLKSDVADSRGEASSTVHRRVGGDPTEVVDKESSKKAVDKPCTLRIQVCELLHALGKPRLQLLCCSATVHLSSTFIRFAVSNWFIIMLTRYPKLYSVASANSFVTVFELGGILGNVLGGYLSDRTVTKGPSYHARVPYIVFQMLFASVLLGTLSYFISVGLSPWLFLFFGLCLGITVFGAISLCGVLAVEVAPSTLSGTSHAFSAFLANVGAILACSPLSLLSTYLDWPGAFLAASLLSGLSVIPLSLITRHQHTD